MAQIGIKLADGSFFPVMDDDEPRRRRVVLSPARKDQSGAQIDIIRRDDGVDQYVGCLVLEDLEPGDDQDLELIIGLDGDRNLDARVGDVTGKQYQSLAVSLDRLEQPEQYALPEEQGAAPFDIGDIGDPEDLDEDLDDDMEMPDIAMPDLDSIDLSDDDGFGADDEADFDDESDLDDADDVYDADDGFRVEDEYDAVDEFGVDDEYEEEDEPRPFNPVVLIAIILITLSLLALGAYGILHIFGARMLPGLRSASFLLPWVVPGGFRGRLRSGPPRERRTPPLWCSTDG